MTCPLTPVRSGDALTLVVLALLITPVIPAPAHAQGTTPRDSAARRIEAAEIRGARTALVVGGASVHVVAVDSQRSKSAPTLADLLRTLPSVLVRTNSRGEVELSVRGSESRQVGILMNGLPLSLGWDGRADPSLVPLTGITRVSYVRSTATVLGGPNSLGGVVELAFDDPERGAREHRLSLGTDHTGSRLLAASAAGTGSRLSWRLGGGLRQTDGLVRAAGVSDPAGSPALRTNTDARQYDVLGSLSWTAANGAALAATVSGYEARRGVAPELHIASPRYWRYPEQSRRLVQLKVSSPRLTSRLGTTALELGGGATRGTTRIEAFADANYAPVTNTESGAEQVHSARLGLTHTIASGAELRVAVTGNSVLYDETLGTSPSSHYRQDLLSVGAESRVLVGQRTLVSGGVVLDRGETIEAGGRPPLAAKRLLGWRLGATRQLAGAAKAHASISSRGRFPALRELYSGSLSRFEPNPALAPERLVATEMGISLGDAERPIGIAGVDAQFTLFHHALRDGIVRVPFDTTNRFQRVNRDATRSTGIETMLGWRGDGAGPSLTVDFIAQRVEIRDQLAGGDRKPEHMPNLRAMLDGTLPLGRGVVAGATLTHVGSQYCVNPDSGNDDELASQTTVGLTAHRSWILAGGRVFRGLRILAGLDNLTNAAVWEQCGLPRAGRTLRLGIDLR